MSSLLTLRSPAKINLFLQVLGRRSDGYHEIASLLQAVDLCDTLRFEINQPAGVYCDDPRIPTDHSNTIVKAIDVFQRRTRLPVDVQVKVAKIIPSQAGLGGGSSNAATTLWALNQLYGKPASLEELQQWAGEIGSDVPFFLSGGTAYCTGRGENITSLAPMPSEKLWIVKPRQGVSTPLIYQTLQLEALSERNPKQALEALIRGKGDYFNDLEETAFKLLPEIALLKDHLLAAGFRSVMMTGSGSALFCLGDGALPHFLEDVEAFSASYLNRPQEEWYLQSVMQ
ncbi:MAG: 4-(cytidine 5'-diphospho)-2-C-methyl-D-erythritol kinase [Waddliaceae bacterium]